jgi:hypothetical protein
MRKVWQLIAVAVVSLGLGLAIGGCTSSTKDEGGAGKMDGGKMDGGKMDGGKMGESKMDGGKMGESKMDGGKKDKM